jgi:hypothetical protein
MHRAQDPHVSNCTSTAFWRNLAVVQKVKIRRLEPSSHVADSVGVRNLKKMAKVENRVVTRLQ